MVLKVYLLGSFQVLADGQPVTGFVSNKVRALLAYLVAESERPHSREALMDLLWPESPQLSAQGNLRYALSNLRKLLKPTGADLLSVSRQSIEFNSADQVWVDIAVFQKLLENSQNGLPDLQSLEETAGLYRGEFLEGLTVSDSAAFDEWHMVRNEQFHRQVLDVLNTLAEIYIERGEYNQALRHAWRQLELEPWAEEAHQQLMRALALSGQRDAALAQYERCRQLLVQELDIVPSPKTVGLFKDIRSGKLVGTKRRTGSENRIAFSNVPHPLTSFIGRRREIAEIERLIVPSSVIRTKLTARLLTLIGAGGCGKTRLAIESAQRLATEGCFPNGVWWFDLARLNDPLQVTHAGATALGLRETADISLSDSLINYLRAKQMLLVLDNCEHLIEACALLAESLLQACPGLQILATSREALDIDGERVFQVNPLPFPDPAHPPPLEKLPDYEAIRLFVERAEIVLPGFSLTHENASAIIHICRQLDGIPLALELSAILLKTMPVEQVAARLEDRFLLLTNGHRTALPHHRTLRGVLDWSFNFLSEEERSLFRQLSIFSGGWTLESVEKIATGHTHEILTALVNKSLVMVEQSERMVRYRMLETIRQYGQEKLAESGQEEAVRSNHLAYFLQFAECSIKELRGGDQKPWIDQIKAEHDNIRMALEWSLRSAETSEAGLRLAVAMSEYWSRCNYYREGRQWLERALALAFEANSPRLRAWANMKISYFAFYLGDFETSRSSLDLAWELFHNLEDIEGMAFVIEGRGALAGEHKHDLVTARACFEESLTLLESIGEKWEMAEALRNLGHVHYLYGDFGKARSCFIENLRICREVSNTVQLGKTLYHLGLVAYQEGDYPSARSYFEESRQMVKEHGNRDCDLDTLGGLGDVARCENKIQQAQTFYEEGLLLACELAEEEAMADFLRSLGHVALRSGDSQRAVEYFNESLQYWQKQNMRLPMAGCLLGLAGVATDLSEMKKAARLLGNVDALMKESGSYISPANRGVYEHIRSATREYLGDDRFQAAWQEGVDRILSGECIPGSYDAA